jgi:hypothetical protein
VFERFKRRHRTQHIDLASVRDTLLYIESDLQCAPELHRLADAVRAALAEIDRIELSNEPAKAPEITGAHFLPATL